MTYLFLLLFGALYSILVTDAQHGPVAVTNCSPTPTSMASSPTLADLSGIWYIYISDFPYYEPDMRCGACQVKQDLTDLTKSDIQCISTVHMYIDGALNIWSRFVTGKMTKNVGTNVFTITGSDASTQPVNMEFVVTHFDPLKASMALRMCAQVNSWTTHTDHVVNVGLAKAGPVNSFTDVTASTPAIQYASCPATTFDSTKKPGWKDEAHTGSATRTTTLNAAGVDCASKGFALIGTAPKQRYVRIYRPPGATQKSQSDAVKACEDLGFTLAMADSQPILDAIKAKMQAEGSTDAWIGLEHIVQDSEKATLQWFDKARTRFQMKRSDGSVIPPGTFFKFKNNDGGEWDQGSNSLGGADSFSLNTGDTVFGYNEEFSTGTKDYICECTVA